MVTEGKKPHVKKMQAKQVARQEPRAIVARHKALGLELEGDVRATGNAPEKKRFLIVCEGKNTEPQYFGKLAHAWRLYAEVITLKDAGGPTRLIDTALSEKEKAEDGGNLYDEVWIVFDKDTIAPHTVVAVKGRAISNGIRVAFSNECFELWLLLHFREDGWQQPRAELPVELDAYLPAYSADKGISDRNFAILRANLSRAVRNARWIEENKSLENGLETRPYTSVNQLVKSMACCNSLHPHIQEEIDAIFPDKTS